MDGLFPLVETAIAFSLVMLAASLVVSAIVQIIQGALGLRSKNLDETLRGLFRGFRAYYNDPDVVGAIVPGRGSATALQASQEIARRGEKAFARDILAEPALHKLTEPEPEAKTLARIEFLDKRDLVSLVGSHAAFADPTVDGVPKEEAVARALKLPGHWFSPPKGAKAALDAPAYATVGAFADYVARWFDTVEATHTQAFRNQIRLLTIAISGVAVMVMCLDGFRLVQDLFGSRDARQSLIAHTADLQRVAARLGTVGATLPAGEGDPGRDQGSEELLLEAQKIATILDTTPGLSLGWQNAWITKQYCAYRGVCRDTPPPTGTALLGDFLLFISGLIFSSVMLSLGAPFWVKNLGSLINLRNEVANAATRRDQAETSNTPPRVVPVPAASAGPESVAIDKVSPTEPKDVLANINITREQKAPDQE